MVNDAKSFVHAAKNLVKGTEVIYISEEEINAYAAQHPFQNSQAVPGITKMHLIARNNNGGKLWR